MKIIGLAGTNGSGKDTVGHLLAKRHGYLFVSVSDLLRAEAAKRGMPIEREALRTISTEWRRQLGLGALIDKGVELFKEQQESTAGLVLASIRNPGEVDRIHELGGTVIWVDADPNIRYNRIASRMRTEEDNKTFEQFMAEEQAEMQSTGDAATLSLSEVKRKADITLLNEGTDIESFENEADSVLAEIIG